MVKKNFENYDFYTMIRGRVVLFLFSITIVLKVAKEVLYNNLQEVKRN